METANPPIKAMEVITPIVVIARNLPQRRDILLACVVSKGSKVPLSFSPAPRSTADAMGPEAANITSIMGSIRESMSLPNPVSSLSGDLVIVFMGVNIVASISLASSRWATMPLEYSSNNSFINDRAILDFWLVLSYVIVILVSSSLAIFS